jgi:hypothetical protein
MARATGELLSAIDRAVEETQRAKSRTQAALRLAGDLRKNVDARRDAAIARAHLKAIDDMRRALRSISAIHAKLTAPVAVKTWESTARAYLHRAGNLVQSTDDIVASLSAHP